MKKEIILIVMALLIMPMAFAYTPVPGSPLANNEHPRLHITKENIEEIRNVLSTTYKTEYQEYVDAVIDGEGGKFDIGFGDVEHNILDGLMVHQALVGLLNISGITYRMKPEELTRRAISKFLSSRVSTK